jgi:hypothetical protein
VAAISVATFSCGWRRDMADQNNPSNDLLKSVIPAHLYHEFLEWARDGGYDESYFNRWDSKSRVLEEEFLMERTET